MQSNSFVSCLNFLSNGLRLALHTILNLVVISLITVRVPLSGFFLAKPSGSRPLLALIFLQREPLVLLASFSLLHWRALLARSLLC